MSSKERNNLQHSKRASSTLQQTSTTPRLPDKIDTKKVVEMIRNADLYDLINISLRSSEMKQETVELFIQKALSKNGQKSQQQSLLSQMLNDSDNVIFTPPTKSQRQQQQHQQTNDENLQPTLQDYTALLKNQLQLQKFGQPQNLLQPSILENSQIPNPKSTFHQQLSFSCQQLEDFLLQKRLSLDEDTGFQIPRDQIPQPYSDQPTSPGEENQSFSQQQQTLDSMLLQSLKKQPQGQQTQLEPVQEVGYKGDQFSFQFLRRESLMKKSPKSNSNSNYSSQKKINEQSFRNSSSKKSPQSRNYEQQLKLQHSQKYQQQQVIQEDKQLSRTLSNFRLFQQQQQQQPLTRSVSSNCLQSAQTTKTPQNKSSQQPTLSSSSKSFLNTSRAHTYMDTEILQSSLNKTPKGSVMASFGQLTSRASTQQQDPTNNTSTTSLTQQMSDLRKSLDTKRSKLQNSFQQMNIKYLIELERIKKPSQLAYVTGRLVCQFFSLFRDQNQNQKHQIHMEDLIEWVDIQKHINSQIIKYTSELLSNVKSRVLLNENNGQRDVIESRLAQLKEDYFAGENLKLFKHLSTNKTLQVIVTFIYNVIMYYLEMNQNDNQQQDQKESQRNSEVKANRLNIEIKSNENQDGVINQQKVKSTTNQSQSNKRLSRHLYLGSKNDTTPTNANTTLIKSQDKSPLNKQTLQKSSSRCLLQRRDRSQLIQKDDSYCSNNKSPMAKTNNHKDLNQTQLKIQESSSILSRRQETSITRSHSRQQLSISSKSPLNLNSASRQSKLEDHNQRTREEIKERLSQIVEQQHEFTQRNSINMFFPIDFSNHDQNHEAPIDFDYKVMVEAGGLSQKIRETAETIEKNMQTSSKKTIDMSLIEQIKNRRKEQKQREISEERCASTSNRLSCKTLQEQL